MNDPFLLAELRRQKAELESLRFIQATTAGELVTLQAIVQQWVQCQSRLSEQSTQMFNLLRQWSQQADERIAKMESSRHWADSFRVN